MDGKKLYNNENVGFLTFDNREDFIYKWNNGFKYANNLHLYLHGGIGDLYFKDNINMQYDMIRELEEKCVQNKVYLYSCHGGTEFEGSSVAWEISKLCFGTPVEALSNDEVDYFNWITWYNFMEKYPLMHNGTGTWKYYYIEKGELLSEDIGDTWEE